jgi:hypothetical protein
VVEAGGAPLEPGDPHANHDPEVVAGLLDRDLAKDDRTAAERQVASCTSCAALLADLRLLASATVALPTPLRTRDFRLTPADAAALGEPVAAATRQNGDMTDTRDHASHDTLLVAALADRTIGTGDRERAEALVDRCGLCAALRDDLIAIRAATRAQPTPPRPRDYQLTPDDAVRLRPGGWRRLVAAFRSSGDVTRPLAVGLTTIGLAGLLVAMVPSILNGPVVLGPSSGAALPESNAAGGQAPSGAAAAFPEAGSGFSDAGSRAVLAPPSGNSAPVRAAAPPAPTATLTAAPIIAQAAPASGFVSAAASAPVYDVAAASPEATAEPLIAAQAPTPTPGAEDKGVQGSASISAEPPLAAIATGQATAAESTSGVAAAPAPTNDQLEAESASSGPSTLVLVSGGFLLAGLGLFAIRRLGRRPLD